ncbi:hypothetical protein [Aestuariibius sp. HNIBRBA575]|uniref:hypothetical protein n=1 Tax=Aestuariibius sp. HNIBRBA575 TaxID=3233343 RepID=UPI0034A49921
MAYGMGMEEIRGESKGKGLTQTLQTIMSVVRQSRDGEADVQPERKLSDGELRSLFKQDLRGTKQETQESVDLTRIRSALYGD